MSKVRSTNTAPEMVIRKLLFARGLRYRLHSKHLLGKPDLILPKFKAVLFVHGCFWHAHGNSCHLFKQPKSNAEFWDAKLSSNRARDATVKAKLLGIGWRVGTIWECAVRGKSELELAHLADAVHYWLQNKTQEFETEPFSKGGK